MRIYLIALIAFLTWTAPSFACVSYDFGDPKLDDKFSGFGRFVNSCSSQRVVIRFKFDNGSDGIAGPILRGNTELYYHGGSKNVEFGWCETNEIACSPPNTDGSLTNAQQASLSSSSMQYRTGPHIEYVGIWSQFSGDPYACWRGESYSPGKTGSMVITPDGYINNCSFQRGEADRGSYTYANFRGRNSFVYHDGIRYLRKDFSGGTVAFYASPEDMDRGAVPWDLSDDVRAREPYGTTTAQKKSAAASAAENNQRWQKKMDRYLENVDKALNTSNNLTASAKPRIGDCFRPYTPSYDDNPSGVGGFHKNDCGTTVYCKVKAAYARIPGMWETMRPTGAESFLGWNGTDNLILSTCTLDGTAATQWSLSTLGYDAYPF